MIRQLTSWSFSVYRQWIQCPKSVYFQKIQRVPVLEAEESPAIQKGNAAHAAAETFIKTETKVTKVPTALRLFESKLKDLRKAAAKVELEWAFDRDWNPCRWDDWKRAFLRMKIDVLKDSVEPPAVGIIDWKTGKIHVEDHRQQRSIYGMGALQLVQIGQLAGGNSKAIVTAQHLYTDTGQEGTEQFKLKDLAPLKKEWAARIKPMFEDTRWKQKESYACRWCPYRKSAGGPCTANQ